MSANVEDTTRYIKEATLGEGTTISIEVGGTPVNLSGLTDIPFPITVPTGKVLEATIIFVVKDAP